MSAVINLRREPKLREQFEYAHVVNNTVLIDRRTRWGNPFRVTEGVSYAEAVARYRVHLWQRIQAGEVTLEELAELDGCWLACWCSHDKRPPTRHAGLDPASRGFSGLEAAGFRPSPE